MQHSALPVRRHQPQQRRVDLVITEYAAPARKEFRWTIPVSANSAPAKSNGHKNASADGILIALEQFLASARPDLAPALDDTPSMPARELTPREEEVLELVLDGRRNKQIAAILDISQRTVEHHRASVMQKLGARSIAELVRITDKRK